MDYSSAYAICINGLWHSAIKVADLGDWLDVQIGMYQSMQVQKSAVDAIKVQHKADNYVGQERKQYAFDLGAE